MTGGTPSGEEVRADEADVVTVHRAEISARRQPC
jgi:hypothetical protein